MNDFERVGRNLVRTFYDPLPTNDSKDPIWLLGERYDPSAPLRPPPSDAPETVLGERAEDESWIRTSVDEAERKEAPNGQDPAQYGGWPSAFLDDFESRIWLTYRSGFAAIAKSQDPKATATMSFRVRMQNLASPGFSSDTGFGCMIRSGQCILANALQVLKLGRGWTWRDHASDATHCAILALFADDARAPFSIHRFVEHGAAVCGKYPGEWFGPSAAARCIQDLANKHSEAGLRVYVSGDGADVYEDKLKATAVDDDGNWQPTLILVGTRLGIDKITPVYWEALKAALQMKQSIGIAGGRPSASHYFVGTQGNTFFYLDPHTTRPLLPYHSPPLLPSDDDAEQTPRPDAEQAPRPDAEQTPRPDPEQTPRPDAPSTADSQASTADSQASTADSQASIADSQTTIVPSPADAYTHADLSSCHTRRIRRLQIREMDPSMLLAFLVTSEHDYRQWKEGVQSVQGKCLVHVQDHEPSPRGQERDGAVDDVESWDEDGLQ